jgi:hypothetical protein
VSAAPRCFSGSWRSAAGRSPASCWETRGLPRPVVRCSSPGGAGRRIGCRASSKTRVAEDCLPKPSELSARSDLRSRASRPTATARRATDPRRAVDQSTSLIDENWWPVHARRSLAATRRAAGASVCTPDRAACRVGARGRIRLEAVVLRVVEASARVLSFVRAEVWVGAPAAMTRLTRPQVWLDVSLVMRCPVGG